MPLNKPPRPPKLESAKTNNPPTYCASSKYKATERNTSLEHLKRNQSEKLAGLIYRVIAGNGAPDNDRNAVRYMLTGSRRARQKIASLV